MRNPISNVHDIAPYAQIMYNPIFIKNMEFNTAPIHVAITPGKPKGKNNTISQVTPRK